MHMKVRLNSVELCNFKNVRHGEIHFPGAESLRKGAPDILGIYGQNGSGKTAFINALAVLKRLLMGQKLPRDFMYFITANEQESRLKYEFSVLDGENNDFSVSYQCVIRIIESADTADDNTAPPMKTVAVTDELLSFGGIVAGEKKNMQTLADCSNESVPILPQSKLKLLTGKNSYAGNDLIISKKLAYRNSQSFLFAGSTMKLIHDNCKDAGLMLVFDTLVNYGNQFLFVVDTRDSGLINLNAALPFVFRVHDKQKLAFGSIPVSLSNPSVIPQQQYYVLNTIINNMNIVLEQIIPNLHVGIENLGPQLLDDGIRGVVVQLTSLRGEIKLPLRNESDGIKKIIAILQLLIAIYNNDSMTVAIDELDAGIFEYLLGEILKILSESGKGQLIFTSHNLRPLETLDDKFICFTTTNPNNRFVRINGVQSNNNLRSMYYRSILLGGQDEKLYDATNNYKIALAFKLAGDICGE